MHNIPMETFVHELSGPHCSYFEHLSVAEAVLAHFCLLTGVFFVKRDVSLLPVHLTI